jgi:alpha-tubulin suppressor-like RCC1 family protein
MMRRLTVIAVVVVAVALLGVAPAHAVDPPLPGATQVDAGFAHSCAVAEGKAWCWGNDADGEVGNGPSTSSHIAQRVLAVTGTGQLSSVRQVSAGQAHSCAVLGNGQARCWGANNNWQLGNGTTTPSTYPVIVLNPAGSGPLTGVRQIAAGAAHTCALLTNGQVRCWGANPGGQLGNGTLSTSPLPSSVLGPNGVLGGVRQISTSTHHTCVALTNGTARCWGANEIGRIGDGTATDRRRAAQVLATTGNGPLTGVRQVTAGTRHSCAVLSSGQARCWGENAFRQLGLPQSTGGRSLRPVVVRTTAAGHPALVGARSIAAGGTSTCLILSNAQVRCFGSDGDGQLGNGAPSTNPGPVPVLSATGLYDPPTPGNLTGITHVSVGSAHACARRNDGRALCWGSNEFSEGGSGAGTNDALRPTSVLAVP